MAIKISIFLFLATAAFAQNEINLEDNLSTLQKICKDLENQRQRLIADQSKILELEKRTELLANQKPNIDTQAEIKKLPETQKKILDAKTEISTKLKVFEESMIRRGCYLKKD